MHLAQPLAARPGPLALARPEDQATPLSAALDMAPWVAEVAHRPPKRRGLQAEALVQIWPWPARPAPGLARPAPGTGPARPAPGPGAARPAPGAARPARPGAARPAPGPARPARPWPERPALPGAPKGHGSRLPAAAAKARPGSRPATCHTASVPERPWPQQLQEAGALAPSRPPAATARSAAPPARGAPCSPPPGGKRLAPI